MGGVFVRDINRSWDLQVRFQAKLLGNPIQISMNRIRKADFKWVKKWCWIIIVKGRKKKKKLRLMKNKKRAEESTLLTENEKAGQFPLLTAEIRWLVLSKHCERGNLKRGSFECRNKWHTLSKVFDMSGAHVQRSK